MTEIDAPKEECGVVAIFSSQLNSSRLAFFSLFALQHRGQESAGIATSNNGIINLHTSMGLVNQVFREESLSALKGNISIGHTRYSTKGSSRLENAQPFLVTGLNGEIGLGHNGNLINAKELRENLLRDWNCEFKTSTDSEVIAHALANAPGKNWIEKGFSLMRTLKGAFSITALTPNSIIAMRDPLGVRPLCLGKFDSGWVVASESCALDQVGATYVREIKPGEVLTICDNKVESAVWPGTKNNQQTCVFELIYFARPDSKISDNLVYKTRVQMGAELAKQHPVDADLVIGVPDSANAAAIGYSRFSGIPFSDGLVKNRYVWRTFISPDQQLRDLGVQQKFNPLPEILENKRVVLVDDSIVRGTTTPRVIKLLRSAGAKEVHMRVCAPPIKWPCYFGVDMATKKELIAANNSIEEIRKFIGATSLGYLDIKGLLNAVTPPKKNYCTACFSGKYPIPIQLPMDKFELESSQK